MKRLMRRVMLSSVVSLCIACDATPSPESQASGDASPDSAVERAEVERMLTFWFDSGVGVSDTAIIRRGLAPTAMVLEDSVWYDRESFVDFILGLQATFGIPFSARYSLSDWRTTVRGDVAWTSLRNRAVARLPKGDSLTLDWRETAVLTRDDGMWRIVRYHSAPVPPAAPNGSTSASR